MLLDHIVEYCHEKYSDADTIHRCIDCTRVGGCSGNCKQCLEEVHYPSRNPFGKREYDCEKMINFYVCDYTHKYASEMLYLLRKINTLREMKYYNILSLGCGACPDLMAFETLVQERNKCQEIRYKGIDKNNLWEPIHGKVAQYRTDCISRCEFYYEDVFSWLRRTIVEDTNVIVLQYLLSYLYSLSNGGQLIEELFELIIEKVVMYRDTKNPMLIIINDVNSINMGRDSYKILLCKLREKDIGGRYSQCYFPHRNIQHEGQRVGLSHGTCKLLYSLPDHIKNFRETYEPWAFCSSAQCVIKIAPEEREWMT